MKLTPNRLRRALGRRSFGVLLVILLALDSVVVTGQMNRGSGAILEVTDPPAVAVDGAGYPLVPSDRVAVRKLADSSFCCLVDGRPELFIGMGDNPIYRYLPDSERAARYERDFRTLCEAGVNHIIGWDVDKGYEQDKFDELTLDYAHRYRLGVLMPFYLPVDGDYEDETFLRDPMSEAAAKIERYRRHPALRMWGVGNEVLFEMTSPGVQVSFMRFWA